MNIDIELDARFEEILERGDVYADTGIRYVVDGTYLDGSPSEYYVSDFVVLHLRRLCDAVATVMDGDEVDLHYLDTTHHLYIDPIADETVSFRTSDEEAVEVDLKDLVRGVVFAAERLADDVVDVNPALEDDAEVEQLRSSSNRLKVKYTDRYGEIPEA
ncbi:hypothetical protein [Haloferax sp. DFSO52]|uniref:hypothetical protein n=1 Tax=Haloferax sp. DFSO52 TaxID=3388505 RepID=UPI003A88C964